MSVCFTVCHVSVQGHVEAYGNYQELLDRGVELMQLIKAKDEDDDREIFSVHGNDDEEEEEEEREEEDEDQVANGGVQVLVSPCAPNSPYKRRNILYITESQSNLAFSSTKLGGRLGDDLRQFPPDSASIYSAHSMLSIHSAVEAESSRHEEEKEVTYVSLLAMHARVWLILLRGA